MFTSHRQIICKYVWWTTAALFPFIIEVRSWTPQGISIKQLEFTGRGTSQSACPQPTGESGEDAFHGCTLQGKSICRQWAASMASYSEYSVGSGRNWVMHPAWFMYCTLHSHLMKPENAQSRALKSGLSPLTFGYGADCKGDTSHSTFLLHIHGSGAWRRTEWKNYTAAFNFY